MFQYPTTIDSIIDRFSKMSKPTSELLISNLEFCTYKKNSTITSIGKQEEYIYFIINGLVRKFYIKDEKDITNSIFSSNDTIILFDSFFNQTLSTEALEALEETKLYKLHYKYYFQLSKTKPDFFNSISTIILNNIVTIENYNKLLRVKSPLERYKMFEILFPRFRGILPQYILASYLNISYSEISRIRSRISKIDL